MNKVISFDLSVKGINRAIKELNKYKNLVPDVEEAKPATKKAPAKKAPAKKAPAKKAVKKAPAKKE